jgi:EpsI family protein
MAFRYIVAILIIGSAGIYAGALRHGQPVSEATPRFEQFPRELSGWWSEDFQASEAIARVLAADATLDRRYRRADGTEVGFYIAYFAQQQVNSQIHSPRNCVPGGGGHVQEIRGLRLDIGGVAQPATLMRVGGPNPSHDIYYWYSTQRGAVAGEYALKWDLVRNSLARRPTNAAFVRYDAGTADSSAIREVMTLLSPYLNGVLEEVGLRCP